MKKQVSLSSKKIRDMILNGCLILLPVTQFLIFYVGVNAKSLLFVFQRYENDRYVFNGLNNFVELGNMLKDEFVLMSFLNHFVIFYFLMLLFVKFVDWVVCYFHLNLNNFVYYLIYIKSVLAVRRLSWFCFYLPLYRLLLWPYYSVLSRIVFSRQLPNCRIAQRILSG